MYETFNEWKTKSSEFGRLQLVYGLVTVVMLLMGGLISLIDSRAGESVATLSLYVGLVFVVNLVVSSVIATLLGAAKPTRSRK